MFCSKMIYFDLQMTLLFESFFSFYMENLNYFFGAILLDMSILVLNFNCCLFSFIVLWVGDTAFLCLFMFTSLSDISSWFSSFSSVIAFSFNSKAIKNYF